MHDESRTVAWGDLARFRHEFYAALTARADALFELTDAVLCAEGRVTSLVDLTLQAQHRRGHGAMYDAVNHGWLEPGRFRGALASLPLPRAAGGRIVLAVDVSPWLRPEASTSAHRLFCHVYGRAKNNAQLIPGWPYSFVVALQSGATSWTAVLDAVRLGPADDATAATATQLREVVTRLINAGHWQIDDPNILIVTDSGYDITRLTFLLQDLPVDLLGRVRSDRVYYPPALPRPAGTMGRPSRHGPEFALARPETWPPPAHQTSTDTTRYGSAHASSWNQYHPRLARRGPWQGHPGELPLMAGTLIRLQVHHLPADRDPKPLWLWTSATTTTADHINRLWQAYLRRFDLEHTFRLFKQTLGWTAPKIRTPEAADRWTWLIIAAHTQLRLARPLVNDLRRPWEKPLQPARLTPARVRRGFRNLHPKTVRPASAPKPSHPGPGRPPGSKNHHPAPRYDVGKTVKQDRTRKHTG
ncbi:NF041680 family putative transposase [Pseudonocardia aurantiaca]|uniref:NF041680 family putative transposase n=1 Tax=Pseudonocardia aurantiaca TaxID=75290 RepID=A0ABW4FXL6_9PSEU